MIAETYIIFLALLILLLLVAVSMIQAYMVIWMLKVTLRRLEEKW